MDKDRIAGSAKQVKGAVKQVVGKAVGDAKLESEGKADKMEGKVQNAIGGLRIRSEGNSLSGATGSRQRDHGLDSEIPQGPLLHHRYTRCSPRGV